MGILQLKDQLNTTIIMVTHEVSSIFRLADRIIFLEHGQVIFQGDLATALKSKNPSIADFFDKAKGKGDK